MELAQSSSFLGYNGKCSPWQGQWRNLPTHSNFVQRQRAVCKKRRNTLKMRVIEKDSENFTRMKSLVVNASDGGAEVEIAVVEKPRLRLFQVYAGSPVPFGATAQDGGVNFAVYSSGAVSATICLISLSDLQEVKLVIY